MSAKFGTLLGTSVVKKQIVALTGLIGVGFIIGHVAGNSLILFGPEAINGYSDMLHAVPELLWIARLILVASLVLHVYFTILVTLENRAARVDRYALQANHGETNWAKKTMIYTGLLVFFFILFHLTDFTFPDKTGPDTVLTGSEGEASYGLYGLVWNSFLSVPRSLFYILAVCCVGLHLSHGIQSLFQTIGFFHDRYTEKIRLASNVLGALVALGFSLVPIFVILRHYTFGPDV
ncbi:MAG: succinate dehydrogenase cytochrome b subunit [Candidatus Hydrogenedentes bacterium]|nr:succinate dehydrogenase cytochrome b subunit [Candidatus Hydrogenedentota bacterium]